MTFSPLFAELTPNPVPLFNLGGFEVNNSMISAAVATLIIIAVVQMAMRAPKLVPSGLQNFVEWIVESLSNFLENITGRETMQRGFWFFGGLFIFACVCNLLALVPGVGTFGWGHGENRFNLEIDQPFLRGANANANLTAAYAAIFFVMWFYWCFRQLGFGGFFHHIFGSKVAFKNPIANGLFVLIFFLVGWIEVFSILIVRPIAFTFRLYGNIFGGEFLLDSIYKMAPPLFAWLFLVPFYFYECLVAVVQAFVFFVLTAAFTGILTNSGDHEAETKDGH